MVPTRDRFEFALERIKPAQWEYFEQVSSAFLASEFPTLRSVGTNSGDAGRDAELFSPENDSTKLVQYSVRVDWSTKIGQTLKRLKQTFPDTQIVIYMSNQQIGAGVDSVRPTAQAEGVYLDVRDRSWFLDRLNQTRANEAAAERFCSLIADPILSDRKLISASSVALSSREQKTALFFLEMQWKDESSQKSLTRSCFEALIKAALDDTSNEKQISQDELIQRVSKMLPAHDAQRVGRFVTKAARRISKSAVKFHEKTQTYHLSFEEAQANSVKKSEIAILAKSFDDDVNSRLVAAGVDKGKLSTTLAIIHKIVDLYFIRSGSSFAAAAAQNVAAPVEIDDLMQIIIEMSPRKAIKTGRTNVDLLNTAITQVIRDGVSQTQAYLKLLSESYTLFAFLSQTPDVQSITSKMFSHGEIWLDTSVLLPVLGEETLPESERQFTRMFKQAHQIGMRLVITPGVIEEIERHINLCHSFIHVDDWTGKVPYLYSRYSLSGRPRIGFKNWTELFCGHKRPEDDIADYLRDTIHVELVKPLATDELDELLVVAVRHFWQEVNAKRREFSRDRSLIGTLRLAEHDTENYLSVLAARLNEKDKNYFGYKTWWLTLDSRARDVPQDIKENFDVDLPNPPVMSIDWLLKYLAFGPNRARIAESNKMLPGIMSGAMLERLPVELAAVAEKVRQECQDLPTRLIQRRIRDAIDREKSKASRLQGEDLAKIEEKVEEMFDGI